MKVRMRFSKLGRVRFTSHRDVARMWERALRRAQLPLAYTAGFSPRPQLSFGLALPTCCESDAEYLDVTFSRPVEVASLPGLISPLLPEGVEVTAAATLEPGAPSLQQEVEGCSWDIEVPGALAAVVSEALARALEAPELPVHRERKGRATVDDLRPSIISLTPADDAGAGVVRIVADVATQPRGVRPAELAEALGLELGRARRTSQWSLHDGKRREPLRVSARQTVPQLGRAS